MINQIYLQSSSYKLLNPDEIIDSADFKIVESFLRTTKRADICCHYIVDITLIYFI